MAAWNIVVGEVVLAFNSQTCVRLVELDLRLPSMMASEVSLAHKEWLM